MSIVPVEDYPRVINYVVGAMGLRGDEAEEAYSEGLVLIVEAHNKYDPSRNVPHASWLIKSLRWGLSKWRRGEMRSYNRRRFMPQPPQPGEQDPVTRLELAALRESVKPRFRREIEELLGS